VNFIVFFYNNHFKKNILKKPRKTFSVDHKNRLFIHQSSFLQKRKKKLKLTLILFFSFKNLKKNHRWLVSLFEFRPKNLSLNFFHFLHSKTFPKWYNTCVYVNWIERNVNFDDFFLQKKVHFKKNILRKLFDHKNWFYVFMSNFWHKTCFLKNRYFDKKNFFWRNELTCGLRKVQNTIYIFLSKIWKPNFENF
jgi:hypothetical protein